MIDKQTIEEIFNISRIEDVIGDYVQLKRAGSNLKGFSPFGNEKTPSFVVSPSKQIWKDFSSGKGGNVVSFLMEVEQYTYPEALRYLAKRYHIQIHEDPIYNPVQQAQQAEKESLFLVNDFAHNYFQNQLWNSEAGINIGLAYFKERGFSNQVIKKFQLGYSPDIQDAFTKVALAKSYQLDYLNKTGLTISKGTKHFDRFKGRVIFPILSFSGRVLGFGGRVLRNTDKTAKYLNSPESEIYYKSKILYGIYHAKQAISRQNSCLLVEGYTDVISLHQAGIENVVASSGTALTVEQIQLVKRLTPNITILYDGDAAGIKASFRGIDLILAQDMNVRVLLFPDGEDPDSFAQKQDKETLLAYIAENSKDFIQFKTQVLLAETQNDPIKKTALIRDIVQSITQIDNLIKREIYIRETAQLLNIKEETLFNEVAQQLKLKNKEPHKTSTTNDQSLNLVELSENQPFDSALNPLVLLESKIIELLLNHGTQKIIITDLDENNKPTSFEVLVAEEIINQLTNDDIKLQLSHHQLIYQYFVEGLHTGDLHTNDFFKKIMDEELQQQISTAITEKYSLHNWTRKEIYVPQKDQKTKEWLHELLAMYKYYVIEDKINQLTEKIDLSTENNDTLLLEIQQMIQIRNKLSEIIGRYIIHQKI